MASLSAFDATEQQTLRFGPLWVFQVIAGADRDWDEKESMALQNWIRDNAPGFGEVTRGSLLAVMKDFDKNMETFALDSRKPGDGLRQISAMLDKKSPADEEEYENALMDLGKHIAGASDSISASEQEILDRMRKILDES